MNSSSASATNMEFLIELAAQAVWDADEVVARIALQYPRRAERWEAALLKTIDSLTLFPERCSLAPEADAFKQEIRQLFHGKRRNRYRILFVIHGNTVRVLRVLHGARRSLEPGEH
jgi:plasmid stabilization system protein ParE